jgi:hypothetical protein
MIQVEAKVVVFLTDLKSASFALQVPDVRVEGKNELL